jgi:hypothetical protein
MTYTANSALDRGVKAAIQVGEDTIAVLQIAISACGKRTSYHAKGMEMKPWKLRKNIHILKYYVSHQIAGLRVLLISSSLSVRKHGMKKKETN